MAHQAAIDREDSAHPEKSHKYLLSVTDGKLSPEDQKKNKGCQFHPETYQAAKEEELCSCCGWTVCDQVASGYFSRIRIFHTNKSIGIWEIGSRWMIRDQPNDKTVGNDFMTQEFLRAQPGLDLPLIKEMRKLSAPTDKVDLTLMSRAEGVGLDTIWHTLSPEQRSSITDQLGHAIKKWRQLTSSVAQKVNGDLLEDCLIGYCVQRTAPTCRKIGRTTDEWFATLEPELRHGLSLLHETEDPLVIDEKYQELRRNFPKSEPYVLTHGDLNMTNIIIKDGKIEAIIDWEHSGYFPWWVERYISFFGGPHCIEELFDPLWANSKFEWEMDAETFQTEVGNNVGPVIEAWRRCIRSDRIQHRNKGKKWIRPKFCACKPWGGKVTFQDVGIQAEHKFQKTT